MTRPLDKATILAFVDEALAYLPQIRAAVDSPAAPTEAVAHEAFRQTHIIKGAAGMVGLTNLSHVAYFCEQVLEELATGQLAFTPELVALVRELTGYIETFLRTWAGGTGDETELLRSALQAYRRFRGLLADGDRAALIQLLSTAPGEEHAGLTPAEKYEAVASASGAQLAQLFEKKPSDSNPSDVELPAGPAGLGTPPLPTAAPTAAPLDQVETGFVTEGLWGTTGGEAPSDGAFAGVGTPAVPGTNTTGDDFWMGSVEQLPLAEVGSDWELRETQVAPVAGPLASGTPTVVRASWLDEDEPIPEDLRDIFLEEANDYFRQIRDLLPVWEQDPGQREPLLELRRVVHTLKGAAGAVGLRSVSRLAHRMEDVFDRIVEAQLAGSTELFNWLHESAATLEALCRDHRDNDGLRKIVARLETQYQTWNAPAGQPLGRSVEPAQGVEPSPYEVPELPPSAVMSTPYPTVDDPDDATLPGLSDEDLLFAGIESIFSPGGGIEVPADNLRAAEPDSPILLPDIAVGPDSAARLDSVVTNRPGPATKLAAAPLEPLPVTSFVTTAPATSLTAVPASTPRPAAQVLRVPLERIDELVKLVGELVINRTTLEARLSDYAQSADELRREVAQLRDIASQLDSQFEACSLGRSTAITGSGKVPAPATPPAWQTQTTDFDDLEFDRYTEFHGLSRRLADRTSQVQQVSQTLGVLLSEFDGLVLRQSRLSRDIQDRLLRVRMVPLGTLSGKLRQTVRTVAQTLHKPVRLEILGEGVEIDKHVLEEMADALLHLLRNAVDHGIEPTALRIASGKPVEACIQIAGYQQGTHLVLEVRDDGGGIAVEQLRATALRVGILNTAAAATATDEQLLDLIFRPGFSTASQVTELSGRGVGLDAVRAHVAKLKGTVQVQSRPGIGTQFIVRLPRTLAITRALLVKAQGQIFALPMQAVTRLVRVDRTKIAKLGPLPLVRAGGEVLRLNQLSDWLKLPPTGQIPPRFVPVLVLSCEGKQAALAVDEIISGREIVVKALGHPLRGLTAFLGATLLGDGSVVPILNHTDLFRDLRPPSSSATLAALTPINDADETERVQRGPPRVLVVDDSATVRRAIVHVLRQAGWEPQTANDGVEAYELLTAATELPRLVLLDIEMPRMDGFQLLAQLRSEPRFAALPVLMCTSRAGEKHREKARQLGATDYLSKPIDPEELVRVVGQYGQPSGTQRA